jgi:thioredoxin reductase
MNVKMIGAQPGGQVSASGEIENFTGFPFVTGTEMTKRMMEQAQKNGVEIVFDTVENIEKTKNGFSVTSSITGEHQAEIVMLSTGTKRRKLAVPGEEEFYGKGVTYCATCDGMFYKDLHVGVVGGGNSAAESALYLANICKSVRVFVRKNHFRADAVLVEKLLANKNITVEFSTEVTEIHGDKKITHVLLTNGEKREVQGLFIEIGSNPEVSLAEKLGVELDAGKFIMVNSGQKTNVPRILAAGDVTNASEKFAQIATAVGEGAIAAKSAYELFQHA